MRPRRNLNHVEGTAWLVADRNAGDYVCYWYAGANGDQVVEHARAATAAEAVEWGRLRTTRVRIRTADARTSWAGTGPRPEGFSHTWTDDSVTVAAPPPPDPPQPEGQLVATGLA